MNRTRTQLAAALAVIALTFVPSAVASAQTADEVFDAIHELVHHWQSGESTAEEVLEQIEELVHSIPASERTGLLPAIDEVVHHAEDGEIDPEAAMAEIEAIVHGAGGVSHADPAPAETGNAGPLPGATGAGATAVFAALLLGTVLGGRALTRPRH
ncbi:MAG: hypothetical protein AB7F65_08685 [Dehalococcoidia bacterium]